MLQGTLNVAKFSLDLSNLSSASGERVYFISVSDAERQVNRRG